ncbi:VWA domain-containing protein [Candidatus Poribacteria bacterium]|jgi:Mg-chelatase subunit ChlD|nr:VWA domain-containing protein [Candidatus Poribacteria bacterium]MBT5536333.1 VWA domain-containing protein [Candidatus Poribacteria bacterium]MBT5713339.1 VWA domain-containing protein [Candidatus Poribacteria bacterium]MBT7100434.1 VWA domain-containing protein [Candidatus Poribacteria bacterium]MBT7804694.1 VWA domain-containing protein [Candidatus Poribacteria bacterium]
MARRRRRKGLPAPLWVGRGSRARRKRRSPIVISLVIHSLLAALAVLVLSTATTQHQSMDTAMAVQFVDPLRVEPKPDRPLKRLVRSAQASPAAPDWQQVASPTPQTIEFADRPVMNAADPIAPDMAAAVTLVSTNAKTRTAQDALPALRSLSSKPTAGQGALTGVQRPQGREGRNVTNSSGAAEVGLPGGVGTGAGRGSGDGSGTGMGSPFRDALARIGDNIATANVTGKVDVLFVVDTSGSMADNIAAVADHLFSMTDRLEHEEIDYQLGVAVFRELGTGAKLELSGWSMDPQTLRARLRGLGVVGNERALDALVQTLQVTRFRLDADRAMVLVTDEPATTKWEAPGATQEMRDRVLTETTRDAIRVQVLGFGEPFQRELAERSGGVFQVIPSTRRGPSGVAAEEGGVLLAATALDTDFRSIAGEVRRWANPDASTRGDVDVVLYVDISHSMQGRLRAVLHGLSMFDSALSLGGLDAAYTLVRFATADGVTGSGVVGVDVSHPFTDVTSIQRQLQYPAVGDEFLLDAIVQGLSAPLRKTVPRISIIVTDEPPSGVDTTADEAVAAMSDSGMRFYGFLPWPASGTRGDPPLHALHEAVSGSGGKVFAMPKAHSARRRGE